MMVGLTSNSRGGYPWGGGRRISGRIQRASIVPAMLFSFKKEANVAKACYLDGKYMGICHIVFYVSTLL